MLNIELQKNEKYVKNSEMREVVQGKKYSVITEVMGIKGQP